MTRSILTHLPGLIRMVGPCLAVLVASWGLLPDAARAGGFYRVAECSPGHAGTPDASVEGMATAYSASTSCAGGNWLQVQSSAAASPGAAKQWMYSAPPGTRIEQFQADYSLVGDSNPDGNRSYLFVKRHGQNQQENLSVVSLGSTSGTYDSSLQNLSPFDAVGIGVFCSKAASDCGYAPGQFARLSNISFLVQDRVPPGQPVVAGDAADGAWTRGSAQLAVGETDVGGGVYRTTVDVNGTAALSETICEPNQDAEGDVGTMAPCDPIELRNVALDTNAAPFVEGPVNEVKVCTHEFGFAAASTCSTRNLRIDNEPPSAPTQLVVAGGAGWHRDNDFDLSWNNPPQSHAPIAGASVTVTGPGGYEETISRSGSGIQSIDDISVPAVGAYTASVYLRDSAGNESRQSAATVSLKFDDTVPVKSQPEKANGWISRGRTRPEDTRLPWQRTRDARSSAFWNRWLSSRHRSASQAL